MLSSVYAGPTLHVVPILRILNPARLPIPPSGQSVEDKGLDYVTQAYTMSIGDDDVSKWHLVN